MPQHHSEDYKITAVNHYLNKSNNLTKTCYEFDCSRTTLKRWIDRYNTEDNVDRKNRRPVSYKITQKHVKYAVEQLKKNEQITIFELAKLIKEKYDEFNVTPQHLGQVLRDNNLTRKRTRHEHFPAVRYKQSINKKKEMSNNYFWSFNCVIRSIYSFRYLVFY
jgi:transposase-like protein